MKGKRKKEEAAVHQPPPRELAFHAKMQESAAERDLAKAEATVRGEGRAERSCAWLDRIGLAGRSALQAVRASPLRRDLA